MNDSINSLSSLNKVSDAVAKRDQFLVDPDVVIIEDGFNTRTAFDPDYWESEDTKAYIKQLAEAYINLYSEARKKADGPKGSIDAIVVKVSAGKIILRGGEHRLRAARLAKSMDPTITKIDARQFAGGRLDELLFIERSNSGKSTTALQKAVNYQRMIDEGMTMTQIANELGKSHEAIRQNLLLLKMPEDLIAMVAKKEVSASLALKYFQAHGQEAFNVINQLAKAATTTSVQAQPGCEDAKPGSGDVSSKSTAPADKNLSGRKVTTTATGVETAVAEKDEISTGGIKSKDESTTTGDDVQQPTTRNTKFARFTASTLDNAKKKVEVKDAELQSAFAIIANKIGSDYDSVPDTMTIELNKVEIAQLLLLKKKLDNINNDSSTSEEQLQLPV